MEWIKVSDKSGPQLLENTHEVLAYHPSWVDPDFNPSGIRAGFFQDDEDTDFVKFVSALWLDHQDTYINGDEFPTHYMPYPKAP